MRIVCLKRGSWVERRPQVVEMRDIIVSNLDGGEANMRKVVTKRCDPSVRDGASGRNRLE